MSTSEREPMTRSMSQSTETSGREAATYDVTAVEEKWQRVWAELDPFRAHDDSPREKRYALTMFPYPSGDLHMGHAEVFALHDVCSHEEVPLSEGDIYDCTVECYLHGSCFDLRSGKPTGPPATKPVPTYRVKIEGDDVYVALSADNHGADNHGADDETQPAG